MASRQLRLTVGALLFALSCAALAENAVTTETASVRAGPDDSYPEVAQLDADSPIEVMGCLDDWSWCDVTFDGNRGWMYSPDITYEYEGGYVPFYTYAPTFIVPVISFTVDTYWGRYYHDRPWYRDREQWSHRVIQHRPPPGPRPQSGPPPREVVRMDRPHGGPPGDRSMRLGRAEPRSPEQVPPSHDERGERDARHVPDSARDHAAPERVMPDHAAPPHAESPHPAPPPMHAAPDHQAPQHDAPGGGRDRDAHESGRPEPQRAEPQHAEPQRAEPAHHEEPRRAEPRREEPRPPGNML